MRNIITQFAIAGLTLTSLVAQPAMADHKSRYSWLPDVIEPGAGHFFFDDEEEEDDEVVLMPMPRRKASLYEQDLSDYYEPRFEPKAKPKTAMQIPAAKKSTAKKVAVQTVAQPAKKKAQPASISCDKGAAVVADYGFSNVEPKACTGKVYTFKAVRTGKNYEVGVSAASGEITDVRKI